MARQVLQQAHIALVILVYDGVGNVIEVHEHGVISLIKQLFGFAPLPGIFVVKTVAAK